jgi:hypothetical protein
MTKRQTKLYNLVMDCYRELYKEATPSADFDELVKNAPINDEGQKMIDFDAYEIDFDKNHEIVEKYIKKMRLTKYEERGFRFEMFLGCAPRTKMREEK